MSVSAAALLNVPVGAIMIAGAVRIVRLTAARLWSRTHDAGVAPALGALTLDSAADETQSGSNDPVSVRNG